MPKLRHIAIAAEDPFATAEFYKQAFDFTEVGRIEPAGEGKSYGVFLSDGTLNMAVLQFGWDQGLGLDFRGIHHFGVLVDDVDGTADKLEKLGAKCFARRPEGAQGILRDQVSRPRQGDVRHHRSPVARQRAARRQVKIGGVRRGSSTHSSWPGSFRPSTSYRHATPRKTWMPGPRRA